MAKLEAKISVEKIVHAALTELVQNIFDTYGIQVNRVRFEWGITPDENNIVVRTNADTACSHGPETISVPS